MSEDPLDEYDQYNIDQDKYGQTGHSGKQRSKKEAELHTNKPDPAGHNRKTVTKLMNNEKNVKAGNQKHKERTASGDKKEAGAGDKQ